MFTRKITNDQGRSAIVLNRIFKDFKSYLKDFKSYLCLALEQEI